MNIRNLFIPLVCILAVNCLKAQNQCTQPFDRSVDVNCTMNEQTINGGTWTNAQGTPDTPPDFCGSIEANLWFPFNYNNPDSNLTVTVTSTNCVNGNGMQVAIYDPATLTKFACAGGIPDGANVPVSLTVPGSFLLPCKIYTIMVDGWAGDVCTFNITTSSFGPDTCAPPTTIQLAAYVETQVANCTKDTTDLPPHITQFSIRQGTKTVFRSSNTGQLAHFIDPLQETVVKALIPGNNLWDLCPDSIIIPVGATGNALQAEFFFQPKVLCTGLDVELSSSLSFIRNCIQNEQMWIKVTNLGTIKASPVKVALVYPSPYDSTDFTILAPHTFSQDTIWIPAPDLNPFQSHTIYFQLDGPCDTSLVGQTLCLKAHAYPDTNCVVNQTAFIEVEAKCLGDTTVQFQIKNTGTQATQQSLEYIIVEDEIVLRQGQFNLQPGGTMTVLQPSDGSTYRLEAEQESIYPSFYAASASLEGCGGFTPGFILPFQQNIANSAEDVLCREVRAAYDPNEKVVSPAGVGADHLLTRVGPLEYTIYFQNTGNDTAFYVRIEDEIPAELDLNTLRPLHASHDYYMQIKDQNTLQFVFEHIVLPDSFSNQRASHGFVKFEIRPFQNLPTGARIENRAAIYFDQNAPIITDAAWLTIGKLSVSLDPNPTNFYPWQVLGNPMHTTATLFTERTNVGRCQFELFSVDGKAVKTLHFEGNRLEITAENLTKGMYMFRLIESTGAVHTGKIAVE
jgi:archaellum component FlaF (FlaF/FlaG flagellin family)